jgi:hypothetical protein
MNICFIDVFCLAHIYICYLQLQCLISKLQHVFMLFAIYIVKREHRGRIQDFYYKLECEVLFMNAQTDVIATCLSYRNINVNKTHNLNRHGNSLHSDSYMCISAILPQTL